MAPYLISYIFYFLILGFGVEYRKVRPLFFVGLAPFLLLILLKGKVGVDTAMYLQSIDLIKDVGSYTFAFEPLFEFMVLVVGSFFDSNYVVLAVFSLVTVFSLVIGGVRLERVPYLLGFIVVPYFLFDMTMNGVRYGVAFSLVTLGTSFLCEGRRKLFVLFAVSAAAIQLTSIVLAAAVWMLLEVRLRTLALVFIGAIAAYFLFADYISLKAEANSELSAESPGSGLAPLVISISSIIALYSDKYFRREAVFQLIALALLSVATFLVAQVFYAGLRLQAIVLFLIYLVGASVVKKSGRKFNRNTVLILFFVGVVATFFRLRNFYGEAGVGDSPFVPYSTFWAA